MTINKVYNIDCLAGLKKMKDETVDLIFTDPPYFQYRAKNVKGLKNHKDVVTEFEFDAIQNRGGVSSFSRRGIARVL
jgi:DNA modification methylase